MLRLESLGIDTTRQIGDVILGNECGLYIGLHASEFA